MPAMLYFSDLNDYEIRGELCQWGPVVIVFHLTWELWMLWLWRRCTYPHLVTHVISSLSDGAHSSLRRCAIHASGGVSGAVTEGLWGTNTNLLYFRSWSGIGGTDIWSWLLPGLLTCRYWWKPPLSTGSHMVVPCGAYVAHHSFSPLWHTSHLLWIILLRNKYLPQNSYNGKFWLKVCSSLN